jgi:hypothetical protein
VRPSVQTPVPPKKYKFKKTTKTPVEIKLHHKWEPATTTTKKNGDYKMSQCPKLLGQTCLLKTRNSRGKV